MAHARNAKVPCLPFTRLLKSRSQSGLVLPHEKLYLSHLPTAERYAKSFMHRDILNFVTVTKGTDFVVTTSVDGHLKLWKKQDVGIEFVKHYRAHLQQVIGVSGSADGTLFASVSEDGTGKVFDVINFGKSDIGSNLQERAYSRFR